jgi:hypothetical protein
LGIRVSASLKGLAIYAGEQVRRVEYNEANRLWPNKVIAEARMAFTPSGSRAQSSNARPLFRLRVAASATSLWRSPVNGL